MNDMFAAALLAVLQPLNLLLIMAGVTGGVVIGALPGLTATMGLALLVPFTFTMQPVHGLLLLGGIYAGAIYGGSFSAILLNTPGTPSAIATTFDGYPMARRGQAYQAIMTATLSSIIGGIIGTVFLLFLSPPLARLSLKFGPPEYFWMAVFGLTIIATLASDSILKGLIGGAFGLLLSTIGIAPIEGSVRYTFGTVSLQGGLTMIPALIGFFCLPEVIGMVQHRNEHYTVIPYRRQRRVIRRALTRIAYRPLRIIRSSIIGVIVGIIPGAGGNIAAMVSYNEAARASRTPGRFGKGCMDGVIAAESANNAEVSGALIPLLTLGIPGAPPAAVLLGVLILQGLRPGMELFAVHGHITYTFILSLFLANLFFLPFGILGGRGLSRLVTRMPVTVLAPVVFFLCMIGSYSINRNMFDVYAMLICGLIGAVGRRYRFDPGPIVLGLILGSICEQGLVQAILMGRAAGSIPGMFFTRPISLFLILLTALSIAWPVISNRLYNRRTAAAAAGAAEQENSQEQGERTA